MTVATISPCPALQKSTPFIPPFDAAEASIAARFGALDHRPAEGTLHIGGERYVLMRAESF